MENLVVNKNWTFEETVKNIEALKSQYCDILASFSCYEIKDKVKFKRNLRDSFYSMNLKVWEIDKLWEYMNDYEELSTLIILSNKRKKNERN